MAGLASYLLGLVAISSLDGIGQAPAADSIGSFILLTACQAACFACTFGFSAGLR
jgi:hypothetical protein